MKTKRLTALLISVLMILQMFAVCASAAYIEQVDDPVDIKFVIPSAETAWTADGVISEGEYGKINFSTSQLSIAASTEEAAAMAITTPISLHMSYDENYVYIAATTSAANYVCDIDNSNAGNMWAAHAVQLSLADINATGVDERLETGYALSSLDNNMYTCTWFDPMGVGYDANENGDFTVVNNGNELVYEMRVPFEAFVGKKLVDGDAFRGSVIWAVGTSKDGGSDAYTHIQLGYGVSGDPGKDPTGHATFYLGYESESDTPAPDESTPDAPATAINIPFVESGAITTDGQKDTAYENAVVFDIDTPLDGAVGNASATASMMSNNGLLYLYVDVTDPEVNTPSADMQATEPWNTDSIELLFQTHNDKFNDVHQFRVDVSGYASYYMNESGDVQGYGEAADKYFEDYAVQTTDTGYAVEMCIDMKQFGVSANETIGIQMQLNDVLNADPSVVGVFYHLNGTAHAFNTEYYTTVYVGSGEDYTTTRKPDPSLGSRQNKNVVYATPEIDGVLNDGEWNNDSSIVINEENGVAWAGETISDVVFYQAWDDNGLYLAGGIEDDDLCLAPSIENVYNLDALQFALDPAGLIGNAGGGGGMFFSVGPMEDGTLGAVYHPYGGAAEAFEYTGAYSATDNGWQFEIMIPWTSIEILADDGYAWTHGGNEVINTLFCVLDRDEDGAVANCYMTSIVGGVAFAPADYPYALKLKAQVTEPSQPSDPKVGDIPKLSADTSLTIDGQMDDAAWADALTIEINQFNAGVETGTHGKAHMLWDDNVFYIYYDISDAEIVIPSEDAQKNTPWTTDSVEMFFDFGGNHEDLVRQFRIDVAGWLSYYAEGGAESVYGPEANAYFGDYAVIMDKDGYNIEAAVNLEQWGLVAGEKIGLQLQINDMTSQNEYGTTAVYNMPQSRGAGSWDADLYDYVVLGGLLDEVDPDPVLPDEPATAINVPFVESGSITVDGTKDDAYANVTPIAVKYENSQAVADMTDGTANVYLATNNGLLYVYAEVNDTEIVAPTEQQHTEWPWATDSLEMFIHTLGNTYQFRVDNTGYPSFYMNPEGYIKAYGPDTADDYFVSYAAGEKDGGYTVEFCIDLKNYGVSSGTELGINFQLNDRANDESQRFIYNGSAGSWDAPLYDTITVGADESYEAVKDLLPTSGTCGENLTWTLEDGVLTISGSGEMGWDPLGSVKSAIKSVVIEDGVTTIGGYAFYGCENLTSVTLPDSVTVIRDSAFRACPALTEIVIPDSVETIELYAFENCPALEAVTFGNSVTVIGEAAFMGDVALKEAILPDSVIGIDRWAFAGCTSLETLVLGDNLTKIGECAFRDNTSLKAVVIPKNVTEIGLLAFFNCTSLESVVFEDCNPVVRDWAFQNCTALRYADLGNALTELGVGMFCDCINLEALYFTGNAPTVIGNDAFWNTPSNVKWYYYEGTEGWTTPIWVGPNGHGYTTEMLPAGTDIPVDSDSNISDLATIPFVDENAIVVDGVKDSAYSNGAVLLINNRHADSGNTGALASASMLTNNGLVYLYVDVVDPQIVKPTPEIQANAPWTADSVEFLFRAHNNVHQFRVDVADYLSYYRNQNGIIQAYGADAEKYFVAHNVVTTENGYAVEFCIDTKMFGVSADETIAIQMQLNDMKADGGWSCYNYRATDHAFTVENFDDAQIGIDENYTGALEMLGTSIGNVPYIKPDRIIIDGQYSSVWDNALKVEIDQFNYGDENASTRGTAYMYWTEGMWYLFVDVKDADVVTPDPEKQASEPWVTDSVEMFFDFGHEHSDLIKQFRIDCSGYPSYYTEDGVDYAYGDAAKDYFDEYKVLVDEDGYNIEMVIDLSKWGLESGEEIGLQLQINDVVSANPAEVYSCWNMHQSMGAGSWDADLYDYITLEAKPVVVEEEKPVEIPVTEDEETVSVKVEEAVVQGSTVTVNTVDESALESIFDAPATEPDEGTGDTETTPAAPANTVTIDVSNVKSEGSEEAEKVQQVTLPATVVDTIKASAEKNNVADAKLAVHLSTGSIILDKATLDAINQAAESNENTTTAVSLVIDDADDNLNENQEIALENVAADETVYGKLEISMEVTKTDSAAGTTESEKIHDFNGGTVQLEVPFEIPEGMDESGFTVYYLDEEGNLEAMDTQYINGKIVWSTGHFSDYIIMYKEPYKEPTDEPSKEPIKSNADEIVDGFCDMVKDVGREILTYEPFYDGTFHLQTAIKDIVNNTAGSVLDWAVKSIKKLGFWLF